MGPSRPSRSRLLVSPACHAPSPPARYVETLRDAARCCEMLRDAARCCEPGDAVLRDQGAGRLSRRGAAPLQLWNAAAMRRPAAHMPMQPIDHADSVVAVHSLPHVPVPPRSHSLALPACLTRLCWLLLILHVRAHTHDGTLSGGWRPRLVVALPMSGVWRNVMTPIASARPGLRAQFHPRARCLRHCMTCECVT